MTAFPNPDITLDVDLRNPGQFFACCGLLELASRLWPATMENGWCEPEGWFDQEEGRPVFNVATYSGRYGALIGILGKLVDEGPMAVLAHDHEPYAKDRKPVMLRAPFDLRLDWWLDSYRGGDKSELKVWAGQMTPIGNLSKLQEKLGRMIESHGASRRLLASRVPAAGMGIDPATSWTAINVGFSPDEQNIEVLTAPATEVLAMIGLQRCRPALDDKSRRRWFIFSAWADPLQISVAPAALAGAGRSIGAYTFPVEMRNSQYGNFGWAKPWESER